MAHKHPDEQGVRAERCLGISDETAALMLVDLAHEIQATAPPRTWIQGPQQPGSRQCLQSIIRAASALRKRPLPYRMSSARRPTATEAVGRMSDTLGATGAWTTASPSQRKAFVEIIAAGPVLLPQSVLSIARTGMIPFSAREFKRLQWRAQLR